MRNFGSVINLFLAEPVNLKNLRYEDIIAVIDTREQYPLDLSPLKFERACLKTADYSVKGYEQDIAVELKELPDFIACCTFERQRFERELERMLEYKYRAIVIKSTWGDITKGNYRSRTTPQAVMGSAMAFALAANVSIIMGEDHQNAGVMVSRLLWVAANRIHRLSSAENSGS